jgi:Mn2+/Fe2+ NRAMP family transporter
LPCPDKSALLGVGFASILFAVALLLASSLNSTVTATLAGQCRSSW